jgi:CRP/FNR family cyclic AMP-dependent transcriptional regulator
MSTITQQRRQYLAAVPLFADLSARELDEIDQRATTLDLEPGFVLVREGTPSKEMIIVMAGEVVVDRGGERIATLGPGDVIGEIGLLGGHVRTATATVVSPSRVLHLDARAFADVIGVVPEIAQRLLPVVAHRAAESTEGA